ncbi:hypothetical protein [Streptomyces flavidovirens]
MSFTMGYERGTRAGQETTADRDPRGYPAPPTIPLPGGRYVIDWDGAPPHDQEPWHYCWRAAE